MNDAGHHVREILRHDRRRLQNRYREVPSRSRDGSAVRSGLGVYIAGVDERLVDNSGRFAETQSSPESDPASHSDSVADDCDDGPSEGGPASYPAGLYGAMHVSAGDESP